MTFPPWWSLQMGNPVSITDVTSWSVSMTSWPNSHWWGLSEDFIYTRTHTPKATRYVSLWYRRWRYNHKNVIIQKALMSYLDSKRHMQIIQYIYLTQHLQSNCHNFFLFLSWKYLIWISGDFGGVWRGLLLWVRWSWGDREVIVRWSWGDHKLYVSHCGAFENIFML